MRASHICLGCGLDLWRVRAVPDPIYRLPVVVCSACGRAAVRGPDRRRLRLLRRAMVSLVLRSLALGFILLATVLVCISFEHLELAAAGPKAPALVASVLDADPEILGLERLERRMTLVMLIAGGIIVGVWLRTGLGHWNPWSAFAAWLGAGLLLISLPQMLLAIKFLHAAAFLITGPEPVASGGPDLSGWIDRVEALLVLAAVSPVGMLLVHSRRRIMAAPSGRARRLGRRLARARRRRRRDR